MFSLRPKSFSGLILACQLLVAIPLLVPLFYSAKSINNLSNQGRLIVYQAEQIERYSKVLADQLDKMEHSIKLSDILDDDSVLAGYYQSHDAFRQALKSLDALQLTSAQAAMLATADAADAEIFSQVKRSASSRDPASAPHIDFSPLHAAVNAFLSQRDAPIARKMDAMQAMADEANRITIWLAVSMLPFALILAFAAARLITNPIQQINQAIQSMGSGELSQPLKIGGPQDLQRLGERLEWLRVSLLELEKQKATFLQHVSHELKTPLTSIREGAGLLSEGIAGQLTEKQKEIAEILYANSLQLQKQIVDLLNFSTLQAGKMVLASKTLALRPLLQGVIQDHRLALENKALRIDLACPELNLEADEQKLRIIVDNLLSNAIKYSAPGGVIEISAMRNGDNIRLEVADSGCGVAPGDAGRIFDAFYQGRNPPQSRTVKGTGLGLAIAREYVAAHGGAIELVEQTTGARFRVTLPANTAATTS
jgi:two-component system sensor histidine kinase GlrK